MIPSHSLAAIVAIQMISVSPSPRDNRSGTPRDAADANVRAPVAARADARWRGSDATIDALAKRAEDAAKGQSPLALGRLYRLWNMNKLVERPRVVERSLRTILGEARIDPLVRDHARYLLASMLLDRGNVEEARSLFESIGLVHEAHVIGPFDNSAGQGHDEPFPPEAAVRLDETVEGKSRPVEWRAVGEIAGHGAFELSHLVHPSSEATAYVLVAIEAAQAMPGALRIGATDQLKVFLDGAEIHSIDSRRPSNLDQEVVPIRVPHGSSLLMIKSSWTGGSSRLLFRLTAPGGEALRGVTVRGDRDSIIRALGSVHARPRSANQGAAPRHRVTTVSESLDRFIERARRRAPGKRVESASRDLADAFSLRADLSAVLGLYDRRKLPTPPEIDLEEAIRLDPSDPTMRFFYAHRAQDRDPTITREELEAALISDPGHVPAMFKLADMARASGRTLEAERRLHEALERDPDFIPAHIALASLRYESGHDREIALISLARAAERLSSATLFGEVARMRRALDDRKGARADAERALELSYGHGGSRDLAIDLAMDGGDLGRALSHLDASITLRPWHLPPRLERVRVLSGMAGRSGEALRELETIQRLFPDHSEIPSLQAELLLFRGDATAALEAIERSLALNPHQPNLRKHRGLLAGVRRELEDEYSVDAKDLIESPVSTEESAWGAIVLGERTAIRLYENGQSTRFQQSIVRLRNPSLKDAVRVHRIAYAPSREIIEVLSAERIRPSGEILKASSISDDGPRGKVSGMYLDRRFKTIAFDDVSEGDVVNIRYRVDSTGQNIFGGFFGDVSGLQSSLPKKGVVYSVSAPRSRPLYHGTIRGNDPVVTEEEGITKLTWSYESLEALDTEPLSPPYPDVGKMVSVSTYKSWADLGRWYAGLFSDQLELDASAREAGRKVVAGARGDAEKIQRLYDYVVKNTRYVGIELGIHGWKPFKAAEVHRRRYGDCKDKATLLAALLRDNGIDATIALVRTSDRGILPGDHATMWAFNHAITYVPSQDLFLDGTAEFSGSRELPHLDQGAMTLVVRTDGTTRLTVLPESKPDENLNASSYTAVIGRDGTLRLEGTERFFGARASALRQEFEEAEQRRTRLEKQLNQVFTGAHVKTLTFSDMSDLEAPVEYHYEANIDRYGVEEGGRTVIPVTLFQHQVASAYGSLASRKYDLYGNHAWTTRNVVTYRLPESATIEALPEGVNVDSPHVSLAQTVRRVPGGFETDDTVSLKSRRIPASEYPEFRRACLAIDRALARKVVIRW